MFISIFTNKELVSINLARGFAAFTVFFYHYGIASTLAKLTGMNQFQWLAIPGAEIAVPLFFVISGFCIHGPQWRREQESATQKFDLPYYIKKRFKRIYPAYIITLLVSLAVVYLNGGRVELLDFLSHLFLLHGFSETYFNGINIVLWTISIEACFYVIYPVWLRIRQARGRRFAFTSGFGVGLLSCIVAAILFYPYSFPVKWFFLTTWPCWLMGALLAETIESRKDFYISIKWQVFGLLCVGSFAAIEILDLHGDRIEILRVPFISAMAMWPLSWLVMKEKSLSAFLAKYRYISLVVAVLGLSSYSLYLLHVPLTELRNYLLLDVSAGAVRLLLQMIWFFLILYVCWLSYRYIERPFMQSRTSRGKPISEGATNV